MELKTLRDAEVQGKTVLLRVDYNVPIEHENVTDDTRIKESLPTIQYLLKEGAKIIIMSHLGRPKGEVKEDLRLNPVADRLSALIQRPVIKVDSCIGDEVERAVASLKVGDILMLENTRFHNEEKENDFMFSKTLASYADIFVSDAFGTVHRAHASTVGVSEHIPSYAGFLIEREIEALSPLLHSPEKPLVLVMGGAKIDTKIGVIKNYLDKADKILVGGGIANTFIKARGFDVGKSLCQDDKIEIAQEILLESQKENCNCEIVIPEDVVVADEISENAITADMKLTGVEGEMMILDIGDESLEKFLDILDGAKTVIWNGPLGLYEKEPFENGTKKIAEKIAGISAKTYLGGGDTIDAINRFGQTKESFTHVSTGGGAMLEFLEGKELPGIKVLMK
ncbi:phosphoglycerate kinase [Patescibacteria group bacterium]|nr:phosphoglycerate kinase [Patescibacteria group bacterium]